MLFNVNTVILLTKNAEFYEFNKENNWYNAEKNKENTHKNTHEKIQNMKFLSGYPVTFLVVADTVESLALSVVVGIDIVGVGSKCSGEWKK